MTAPPWRATGGGAYTAVDARRTLGGPKYGGTLSATAPMTTNTQPQNNNARTTFPDKLKQYVARTFEDCPEKDKPEVEVELKRIITEAFNEKVVWTIDWDNMLLPQALIAKRKQEQALGGVGGGKLSKPADDESPTRKSLGRFSIGDNTAKKRKGDDLDHHHNTRNDKHAKKEKSFSPPADMLSQRDKEKRARRFGLESLQDVRRPSPPPRPADANQPLVGTCTTLEKRYLRLTSEPDPSKVRPLHILKQALEFLKKKWRKEQNYAYICDQFKSLRQDLTVQHIKNDFTVLAYEIHARIALEKGDLGEYNQCQSQLATLYEEGIKGHNMEFKGYRILYAVHTANRADMNDLIANLTPAEKADEHVKHALDVRAAVASGNYHRLFQLYLSSPSMGAYLMDAFVTRERLRALAIICKAYRPDIDTRFLTEELGFESDHDCITFIIENVGEQFISQKSDDKGVPGGIRFLAKEAQATVDAARAQAMSKIDLRGQI